MYREILLLTVPIGRFEAFASTVVLFAAKDSSDDCSSTTASVAYSIKIYLNITINYITDFLVLLQFFQKFPFLRPHLYRSASILHSGFQYLSSFSINLFLVIFCVKCPDLSPSVRYIVETVENGKKQFLFEGEEEKISYENKLQPLLLLKYCNALTMLSVPASSTATEQCKESRQHESTTDKPNTIAVQYNAFLSPQNKTQIPKIKNKKSLQPEPVGAKVATYLQ